MRWIDELNGLSNADAEARAIRFKINRLRKESNTGNNRREIRRLYAKLDEVQFKPDYINIIMDRKSDYRRLCKGFKINGIAYKRLLGTNNGIKNSTIVFVSERLYGELFKRIENGRNLMKPLNPAKLEAYRALTCSASIPVSMPKGILVVDEYKTEFLSDIIYLANQDNGEPIMEERKDELIKLNACDGFGIMCPALAERWSNEIGLDYIMAGGNLRGSFTKGMVFTFDFHDFADKVAGSYYVKDAWGDTVDIRNVELVLNTSLLKLWSSYDSCESYLKNTLENHYTYGLAKVCPKELENERKTNYQFVQSIEMTDDDIAELISPTLNEIKDVLGGDWRKTVLFLRGKNLNDDSILNGGNHWVNALMVEHDLIYDPYIRSLVYRQIKNRINEAKIGVLNVRGNYSIVSGDPYAFCQHIFGLDITGLLKAGELYNKYWCDRQTETVACFRAPMSCHNNIRLMHPVQSDEAAYWFKYMNTCTIINAWDTTCAALNGMDFDGDLMMLTDNRVLVEKTKITPAIVCEQKTAPAMVPTEADVIESNINSFGNEIGKITNYVTSMYEVASRFPEDSVEYETLQYRIKCGQLIQQDAIDAAKGIIAKPMPAEWHDPYAVGRMPDGPTKDLYKRIVAARKPYFMRYIYPTLSKDCRNYDRKVNSNATRQLDMGLAEALATPIADRSEKVQNFLDYYERFLPVGDGDCLMNKICHLFEREFDGHAYACDDERQFDYQQLIKGVDYSAYQYDRIKQLYTEYCEHVTRYMRNADLQGDSIETQESVIANMREVFVSECCQACPNEDALCDIVVTIAMRTNGSKKFMWDLCGDVILKHLLEKCDGVIEYPQLCDDGEITYGGYRFAVTESEVSID